MPVALLGGDQLPCQGCSVTQQDKASPWDLALFPDREQIREWKIRRQLEEDSFATTASRAND